MKHEPLVLCLTNTVAANFTANCLLAIGARPAMIGEPCEAAELAAVADALLVNLGTVTAWQADVMRTAIKAADEHGTPWVLDPVAIQFLSFRRTLADEFLALKPSLIRGNHAEIRAILGNGKQGTGIGLNRNLPTILSTGETDLIYPPFTSSRSPFPVPRSLCGGTPHLASVTATGCAQGAICAAFLGRGQSPENAAISASKLMKSAGERAAAKASAPGSFQIALLDALWELTHD